ncbi:MAG TPA: hypothetical protein VFN61_09240, partial [Acidimicrobiales bacterium]|nr:hypothetical protein [Acidimicrobiales bacterium]
ELSLGASGFLIACNGRRRLTPSAWLDRVLAQSGSAALVVLGIGIVAAGFTTSSASPHWLVRGAVIALGTSVVCAGLTTALRRPWHNVRLFAVGFAALATLSATAVAADAAGAGAGTRQTPFAGNAWSDTGFWTANPTAKTGAVGWYRAVACPTAQFCAAWGAGPFGASVWSISTDGGAKWVPARRAAVSSPAHWGPIVIHYGLSCWGRSYCVAAGSPPVQSIDGGRQWAPVLSSSEATVPSFAARADCFAAKSCMLLCYRHNGGPASPIMVTHDEGKHWVRAALPPGAWSLDSAYCTGPERCIAVGSKGPRASPRAAELDSADGGLSWHSLTPPPGTSSLSDVTCPAAARCVAVGSPLVTFSHGDPVSSGPAVFWSRDGGRSWARSVLPSLPGGRPSSTQVTSDAVGCSDNVCTAIVSVTAFFGPSKSELLLSTDYGRTWALNSTPRSLARFAAGADIQALACNATRVCAAVGDGDDGGVIFYSHDGGLTWATAHGRKGGPAWS